MTWIRPRLVACGQGLVVGVLSEAGAKPLLVLSILAITYIPLFGVGIFLVPVAVTLVRLFANERRLLAYQWEHTAIPEPYRPRPQFAPIGLVGSWQRCKWMLTDPATWRDLLWLLCAPVNLVLSALPALVVVYGLEGVFAVPIVTAFAGPGYGYTFGWAVDFPGESLVAIPQGILLVALGLAIAPRMQRVSGAFAASLLGPIRSATLSERVQRLTETRADAVDTQAAELRRLERDLHDGAQARMVMVGMSLGMAKELIHTRPEAALQWLAEARESNVAAQAELRELIRGIYPPSLAAHGLKGAVEGLAWALPIPVDVDIDLPGRVPPAVESAAYFAVAEALANVGKHSGASRAWVMVRHTDGRLLATVADDGAGGADPQRGTGLRGIQRRLAAFDGTLDVASPHGGPTVVTMELPCVPASGEAGG